MPFLARRISPRNKRTVYDVVREVQPRRLSLASSSSPVRTTKKVEPKTPQRDIIASTINIYRGTNGRVSAHGWEQVIKDLHDSNITMSLKGVKKIGYPWWNQKKSGVPVTEISVARNRKKCGRSTPLTPTIARRMMAIQAENFGKLSSLR